MGGVALGAALADALHALVRLPEKGLVLLVEPEANRGGRLGRHHRHDTELPRLVSRTSIPPCPLGRAQRSHSFRLACFRESPTADIPKGLFNPVSHSRACVVQRRLAPSGLMVTRSRAHARPRLNGITMCGRTLRKK